MTARPTLGGAPGPLPEPGDATGGLAPATVDEREAASTFSRYLDLVFIGAGGMGKVYRAHDPLLGRTVALKFIHGHDPSLAGRLLAEARAQARIEHPHVCRVYEAGEAEGRPFIAMQHIEGDTLRVLRGSLTLEQKLKVMREAAEGVHAAHRVGIVHRDLKPSNILLERTPDGDWAPYVMDFGIAREVAAPGLTLTGATVGTPWYMPPEQARGATQSLDRRSDVYSLGATLYDLLAGHPPFEGTTSVDVLVQLMTEDPVPLGVRDPTIPADVSTIVMKCLEKDPQKRYDSARALAEDLGRYLDGEPIAARPIGLGERLTRRARKNKALVATVAGALVLVLLAGVAAVKARLSAREQAALAAEFARDVQDVDWLMRAAAMAPLHDVGAEKQQVRLRLARIEQRMGEAGASALGPGSYALGRGQVILGDLPAARAHLERAWNAGYRRPEVAYALGLALGGLYRREREAADAIGMKEARAARHREIEGTLRTPALAFLREGAASGMAPPEYVAGLLAFYERRHAEALANADAAIKSAPWLHEARVLKGDVHAVISRERHETGAVEASREALLQSEASYRAAADYARSDPLARDGLCQTYVQRMEWVVYQGVDLTALFEEAKAVCGDALTANPQRASPHIRMANIHRFSANSLLARGGDPRSALDAAIAQAREAVTLEPQRSGAHGNLGIAYRLRATWERDHGLDPTTSLTQALAGLARAAELAPDPGSLNDLANAHVTRALVTAGAGGDPRDDLARGIAGYDAALARVPDFGYAHANRGLAYVDLARYQSGHGLDPAEAQAAAVASLARAVALLPHLEGTHTRLADAHLARAEHLILIRGNPATDLQQARAGLAHAARVNAKPGPDTWLLRGSVAAAAGEAHLDGLLTGTTSSAASEIAEAAAHFGKARTADETRAVAHRRTAEAALLLARLRLSQRADPRPAFAAAQAALAQAVARDARDAFSWALAARLHWHRASAATASQSARPKIDIDAGLAAADRALAVNGSLADALACRATLLRLAAVSEVDEARSGALEQDAEQARARALAVNGHLKTRLDADWERLAAFVARAAPRR